MTRLIELLISFAIVFVLFVVVGIFLPQSRHLSESVETNRKMTIVYDVLNSTRRFTDWNPILLHDPKAKITRSGPEAGLGAKFGYASTERGVGTGSWTIKDSVPGQNCTEMYKATDAATVVTGRRRKAANGTTQIKIKYKASTQKLICRD